MKKQLGFGFVHALLGAAVTFLGGAVAAALNSPGIFLWTAILVSVVGICREALDDFGQDEPGFMSRVKYSLDPRNFSVEELREDWIQALAWPVGAFGVLFTVGHRMMAP